MEEIPRLNKLMRLHELLKVKTKPKKRLGRGIGSGRGKTSGRGSKGQKARGKIPVGFSGSLSLYKKLPLRRGLGNPKISPKIKVVTISQLNVFPKGSLVNIEQLISKKVITEKEAKFGVKILAGGELTRALKISLPVSKFVLEKIKKSGGKIDYV